MKTRIILGLTMISIISGVFYLDHSLESDLGFCIIAVLMMGLGSWEICRMAGVPGRTTFAAVLGTMSLQVATWLEIYHSPLPLSMMVLWGTMLLLFSIHLFVDPRREELMNIFTAAFTVFYIGYLGSFYIRLRGYSQWGPDSGLILLVFAIAVTKGTDVFAYFTGKFLGRHKWIPRISPGKTWEGLIGGLLGAGGIALFIWYLTGGERIFLWYYVFTFGIMLGFLSQVGDLAESVIKRSLDKKDSGQFLPEFGGVMDIIDSLLFTGPLIYFVLLCI